MNKHNAIVKFEKSGQIYKHEFIDVDLSSILNIYRENGYSVIEIKFLS